MKFANTAYDSQSQLQQNTSTLVSLVSWQLLLNGCKVFHSNSSLPVNQADQTVSEHFRHIFAGEIDGFSAHLHVNHVDLATLSRYNNQYYVFNEFTKLALSPFIDGV